MSSWIHNFNNRKGKDEMVSILLEVILIVSLVFVMTERMDKILTDDELIVKYRESTVKRVFWLSMLLMLIGMIALYYENACI